MLLAHVAPEVVEAAPAVARAAVVADADAALAEAARALHAVLHHDRAAERRAKEGGRDRHVGLVADVVERARGGGALRRGELERRGAHEVCGRVRLVGAARLLLLLLLGGRRGRGLLRARAEGRIVRQPPGVVRGEHGRRCAAGDEKRGGGGLAARVVLAAAAAAAVVAGGSGGGGFAEGEGDGVQEQRRRACVRCGRDEGRSRAIGAWMWGERGHVLEQAATTSSSTRVLAINVVRLDDALERRVSTFRSGKAEAGGGGSISNNRRQVHVVEAVAVSSKQRVNETCCAVVGHSDVGLGY